MIVWCRIFESVVGIEFRGFIKNNVIVLIDISDKGTLGMMTVLKEVRK